MVLSPGTRLGAYEILAPLGAGGMGEVYRGKDTRLGREVAIKVVSERLTNDSNALARLQREARAVASLSHPNIVALYDIGSEHGVAFIVMELLEGEPLNQCIAAGGLPWKRALEIAASIADALASAHGNGVVHRDLKPTNIFVTREGHTKVLDFGLARHDPFRADALTAGLTGPAETEPAIVLGTVAYMSPEQAKGEPADQRSDIFALGCVLYEMLSGRRAFGGGTTPETLAAILRDDPADLAGSGDRFPTSIETLVRRGLEKKPEQRFQSARDLAFSLREILRAPESPAVGGHVRAGRRFSRRSIALAAALVAIGAAAAAVAIWALGLRDANAQPIITRLSIQPSATVEDYALSRDGLAVAYAGNTRSGERHQLFVRRFDQFDDIAIAGTEDAQHPFFSPDGQWVAYFSARRLMKVNVRTGSTPVVICECAGSPNGAAWLTGGTILFTRQDRGLLRVPADGGEPVEITSLSASPRETGHHYPAPLPGGALLYTSSAADGRFDVVALRPATGERKTLLESASDANYLPSGHLVFHRNAGIHVAPFDARRLELTGPIVTLVDRIGVNASGRYGGYGVSANGTLAFRHAPSQEGRTLAWVSRTGQETTIPVTPRAFSSPRASPDGTRIAFAVTALGRSDIYVYELASTKLTQLTRAGNNKTPLWTRDGRRLVYSSDRDGAPRLWWEPADGSGTAEAIVSGNHAMFPGSWSADGRTLVYVDDHSVAGSRVFAIDVLGDRKPRAIFPEIETRAPSLSPDGRWLALTAAEAPYTRAHITDFPNAKGRREVSSGQGRQPLWSRDGRELVFRSGTRMFSVAVNPEGRLQSSAPTLLFDRTYVVADRGVMGLDYDLAPDGRFLMIKPSPDELRSNRLNIVMNWIEEVKQRAPTPK